MAALARRSSLPVSPSAASDWRATVGLLLLAVVLAAFWHSLLLFPLRILVVLFHELGHACVALITGGEVLEIGLSANEGGYCITRGGSRFLVLNGGYLGSLAAGVAILALSRARRASRGLVFSLGVLVLLATLFFLRPLVSFGFLYGALAGAGLLVLGLKAPAGVNWGLLRLVGLFSVLYALLDVRDDVFRGGEGVVSDATMLAELTHLPAAFWGIAWVLAGLAALFALRKRIV